MAKKEKWFHITYVEKLFTEIVSKYVSNPKTASKLFKQVVRIYSGPTRHYHNMYHIFSLIGLWECHKHLLKDPDEIFFAIIYHDIVYSSKRSDNEQKSADFFFKKILPQLNVTDKKAIKIKNAILATRHSRDMKQYWENDVDIQYLLDFDLDILGTRHKDTYEYYRQGVRKEYSMYSLRVYKKGRKAVLESFLKRPTIYLTDEFKIIEKRARKNLRNEIKSYLC